MRQTSLLLHQSLPWRCGQWMVLATATGQHRAFTVTSPNTVCSKGLSMGWYTALQMNYQTSPPPCPRTAQPPVALFVSTLAPMNHRPPITVDTCSALVTAQTVIQSRMRTAAQNFTSVEPLEVPNLSVQETSHIAAVCVVHSSTARLT